MAIKGPVRSTDMTVLTTASAHVGADRLGVLRTKVVAPGPRPGIVARPRLVGRMLAASTPLIGIFAAAGYGKSSAAAEFAREAGRPVAWLSIDPRDTDAATLARGIAAAVATAVPVPGTALDRVADPGHSPWSVAVPTLAATLADLPPLTIVLDDLHHLDGGEAVDVLLGLFGSTPTGARMLLVGRAPGGLPVARLEAAGLLTTVGREDLALDQNEVEQVLAAAGVAGEPATTARVLDSTEGWAAGVYLTALASSGRSGDIETPAAGVSPTAPERLVEEYLRAEVLASMAPDDADLLVRSSVVDRWSGRLCDAILERKGSGAALDRLERTNLFLIPLDPERTWYRPHHLLGDLFRADLVRREPQMVRDLLGRAAAWHIAEGLPEQALEYAMQAGDDDLAAALAVSVSQATLNSGRLETVRRWYAWFDHRGVGQRTPLLAAFATLVFALSGDDVSAMRWADVADEAPAMSDRDVAARAISRCCLLRDGLAAAEADAVDAVALLSPDDPLAAAAQVAAGLVHALAGRTDAAVGAFTAAVAAWDGRLTANLAGVVALVHLAAINLERGDRPGAEAHVRRARATLQDHGMSEQPIAAAVDALDARLAIGHGAIEQGRRSIAHALRLRTQTGAAAPWMAGRIRLDLIRAFLAMGDGGGARTILPEVHDLLRERPDLGSLVDEARELEARVDALRGGVAGASTLTMAELRLLPMLTTHLTFREIGERLFVSQNTVKTQAISIYRKLDATSRSEAVDRALAIGLLGAAPEGFIRPG